jgi:parallel beta-helix repeat protein
VRGFRITNRNKFGDGIQLIDCNDCVIHGNVFNTTYDNNQACGLYLENADNSNICYNEFTNFWKSVALADSMMNHIEHNNFNTTSFGSHFFHAYHLQYLPKFIIGNKFKNNYYPERFFVKTVLEILNYSFDLPSEFFKIIEGPKTFAVPIVKLLILEDPVPNHSISFPFLIPVLKFEWNPSIQPHTIRG